MTLEKSGKKLKHEKYHNVSKYRLPANFDFQSRSIAETVLHDLYYY